MRPKGSSAIFRPDLGQAMMEYIEGDTMGYIGLEVMPIYKTIQNASTYPVVPKEALIPPDKDVSRAPRAKYNRDDWEYERGQFQTVEKGVEEPLDDSERKMFDQESQGVAEMISTKRAYNKIMRAQEIRIANKIFNETNFTAHAVSNEWDDGPNATPITDVNDAILAFRLQCGMLPDALTIAYSTFVKLRECDQIVDRLKYTFPGIDINQMTSSQLAAVFGVPRVLIGGAIKNSSGKAIDASMADVWSSEYAALVKISDSMDLSAPGVGRTFLWTEDSPQSPIVESYREDQTRSDVFRVRHHVDEAFCQSKNDSGTVVSDIAAACVYLLSNITT